MKTKIAILIAVLGLLAGGWIGHQLGMPLPFVGSAQTDGDPSSEQSAVEGEGAAGSIPNGIVALGWIEPAQGVIDIGARPGDRLESLEVAEGSVVEEGQPLAYLESRSLRQYEWEALESQVKEAEARHEAESKLADARITTAGLAIDEAETIELDIEAQGKKIEALQAGLELARNDLARLDDLSEDLVSEQERERQALLVKQADAELGAAEAMLRKMTKTRQLSLKAAEAKLQAAKASKQQVLTAIPVGSLKKQRDLAKKQWEQTIVEAPCKGTVLKVFTKPGESIGPTAILEMACLDCMVVVAEVYETDVKRISIGQAAVVTSRALPPPYDHQGLKGEVVRIGKIIAKPGLKNFDPLARADRHVVEVRIKLDEQYSRQAAGLSNLQIDVTFLIKP